MYYIYIDEAGTSALEPVTVVAGVIIDADRHWRLASEMVADVLDEYVPAAIRPNFLFHAKKVWGGLKEYRHLWTKEQRFDLIAAMASIPRFLPSAITIAKCRRDYRPPIDDRLSPHAFHHLFAFTRCIARSNKYVRDWGSKNEVATVVAEDVPEKRKLLRIALEIPEFSFPMDADHVIVSESEKRAGKVTQTNPGPIDRIVDTIHFVEKHQAPLLQIADACAFSFRRYFAGEEGGDAWIRAALGGDLIWSDWQGPASDSTFGFDQTRKYPKEA
ncbi:DUF3800 domain-containing protein [Bosea sp. (in: a-proteobacteria)]|uniref:DUF3800 domain-containing protein n=1 Tax=Bosea sp. (in: a-proteobacteria) TaxID=1871050 RepID=UPI00356B5356